MVTTEKEDMSHTDGGLASVPSSKINTPISCIEELPRVMRNQQEDSAARPSARSVPFSEANEEAKGCYTIPRRLPLVLSEGHCHL
jgi:hypothetical protein